MQNEKKTIQCPHCGESNSIKYIGKRYAMYPAGCVAVISLPFAVLHQAQLPVLYRCEGCEREFGVRTMMGKVFRFILILFIAVIVLGIVAVFLGL